MHHSTTHNQNQTHNLSCTPPLHPETLGNEPAVLTNRVTRGVTQGGAWRATPWQIWMLAQLRPSVVTASLTRHLRDELRHHRYVTTASRAQQQPCLSLHTTFGRVWCSSQSPTARELIARANLMGMDGSRGFCSSIFTLRPLWTATIVRSVSEGTNSAWFVHRISPSICIFCPPLLIILSRGTQSPNARGLVARGPSAGKTGLEVFVLRYSSLVYYGRLRFSDRAVKEWTLPDLPVGFEQGQ